MFTDMILFTDVNPWLFVLFWGFELHKRAE